MNRYRKEAREKLCTRARRCLNPAPVYMHLCEFAHVPRTHSARGSITMTQTNSCSRINLEERLEKKNIWTQLNSF